MVSRLGRKRQTDGMNGRLRRLEIDERGFSRRLTHGSRFRVDRVHPYRYVHEPREGPSLRVCLHSSFLSRSDDEAAIAFRLLGDLRSEYYEVFRTPGVIDPEFEDVPAMTLGDESDVPKVVLNAFGHEVHTGVLFPDQWFEIADHIYGDRVAGRQLIELKAAEELQAHILITMSPALLGFRDTHRSKTAVLSPLEALPLLWAWARAFGDYWDGSIVTSAKHYYWALARAITPSANPGLAALILGQYAHPKGEELVSLGQSALVRLATAIEDVDDIYRAWQLPTDNDTIDRICERFDQIVLGVAAILDNLALLAIDYFGVTGLQRHQRSLSGGPFLQKLRSLGDNPRAVSLADYLAANRPRLTFHAELRHHAVHRAKLAGIWYRRERDPEEMRIRIVEPALSAIWDQLLAAGEDPSEWGISNRFGPRDTPVTFVDQPGRIATRHSPGEALLDPIAFAPRLVAVTAGVVNDIFDRLRLQTDKAWSEEQRAQAAALDRRTEWPFRDVDRAALILTSPLTGLV